ncbi:MAG: class I SAM-dependent methyltransferase [Arachnia sp.]
MWITLQCCCFAYRRETVSTFNPLPAAALDWLAVWPGARALAVGGGPVLARRLRDADHEVFALGRTEMQAHRLWAVADTVTMCGRAEAIPLDARQFDVVVTHQEFHLLDAERALPEIARVLRPGGAFSASYVIRDDSVPWVRRFAALLRHFDPDAMKGDYGHRSLETLRTSGLFPDIEQRAFRIWQPVSESDLLGLVKRQPLWAMLTDSQRSGLTGQVMDLFKASVRPGEHLRLPFQLLCWRGFVNHDNYTWATGANSALNIRV